MTTSDSYREEATSTGPPNSTLDQTTQKTGFALAQQEENPSDPVFMMWLPFVKDVPADVERAHASVGMEYPGLEQPDRSFQ